MNTEVAIDIENVKQQALQELYEEKYRMAVEAEKQKLRIKPKSLWDRLFPYKIVFIKK